MGVAVPSCARVPAVLAGLCQGLWATPLCRPRCCAGVGQNCRELQQPQGQQWRRGPAGGGSCFPSKRLCLRTPRRGSRLGGHGSRSGRPRFPWCSYNQQ